MRRLRKEVRVGLIGSMAVVAGLAGVLTFATAAGAKKTTTTTTASTTTTTVPPTTTTTPSTVPCTPAPASATSGAATLTLTPGTCLNGGTSIAVTGSGFDPGKLGTFVQCNNAAGQPTVALPAPINETLNVSCTGIVISKAITVPASGDISATYIAIAGQTGPPCGTGFFPATCPATDSSGGAPATDAANYPCPPTAAQLAAGASCTLAFGDEGGAAVTVPISYVMDATTGGGGGGGTTTATTAPATSSSTAGSGTTGAAAAAAPTTAASSGSLAFTGPGTGLYIVGAAGLFMILLGIAFLGLSGVPNSLVLAMRRRRRSS